MKQKVYVALKVEDEVIEYLRQFFDVAAWDDDDVIPRETLLASVADCDGVMLAGHTVDEELLRRAPRLKVVSNVTVGYNNFTIAAMKQRQVLGSNTPGVVDDSTADLVFGLILATARKIPQLNQYVKDRMWTEEFAEEFYGTDVHHTTLGIIGMGRIGQAIAKRARGFDMRILYYNRSRNPQAEEALGAKYRPLDNLLGEADFVVLMTPLSAETMHLMGEPQFRQMKKSAIFINASRGGTVDQPALVKALQEGWIMAAGLDVFSAEPIDTSDPLLTLANVVTVPHIGTATRKTSFDMAMLAARNLTAALQGQQMPNLVKELQD